MKAESKAKKTAASKSTASTGAEGEKKKRKKVRKETWSSYVYKGTYKLSCHGWGHELNVVDASQSSSRSTLTRVSRTRLWPSSTPS